MKRDRRRLPTRLLIASVAAATAWLGIALPEVQAASVSSTTTLADPDTVVARSGEYVTYGTTIPRRSNGCGNATRLVVPYLVHGGGEVPRMAACAAGDAMPDGPGSWAEGNVWAPGVARVGDRYVMYYTASKKGTPTASNRNGQKCIGRAWSTNAKGPFTNGQEWACPPSGRWVIDADPFVSGGNLFVTYRDDAVTRGRETGLSVVRANPATGFADFSTRRTLLTSTDVAWESTGAGGGTNVVENPSMWREPNGQWYLMFSGNSWQSPRYATGIARCGSNPLAGGKCTPVAGGVQRPYFGFRGQGGLDPVRTLPGNHPGPGGMSVFQTPSGVHQVVWHWYTGETRRSKTGELVKGQGDSFTVR